MKTYIVRSGDSLYGVARRFGVSVDTLVWANQIADPAQLAVGQALVVPDGAPGGVLGEIESLGYAYTNIDRAVLRETLPYLTYLAPFTWEVDVEGNLNPPGGAMLVTEAYAQSVAPVMSIANLKPGGGFSSDVAHAIITDPAVQDKFVNGIVAAVKLYDYYAVALDIEYVYAFDRDGFTALVRRLRDELHPMGVLLGVDLAPKVSENQKGILYEGHDYGAMGTIADFILLMTYEWGYTYGPPMAVSPVDKMRPVLDYAVSVIPRRKILMGMSNYGYNWTLPWKQGTPARVVSNANAPAIAAQRGAEILFDRAAQAPYFYYNDSAGVRHVIWFEDTRSVRGRLQLVDEYNLRGIFWWTVNKLFRQGLLTYESMFSTENLFRRG